MASVEDIIMPSEEIRHHTSRRVRVVGGNYNGLVTSHRLILWRKAGLLGRLDHTAYRLKDISGIEMKRQGFLGGGAVLALHTPATTVKIEGPKAELLALHQHLNQGVMEA